MNKEDLFASFPESEGIPTVPAKNANSESGSGDHRLPDIPGDLDDDEEDLRYYDFSPDLENAEVDEEWILSHFSPLLQPSPDTSSHGPGSPPPKGESLPAATRLGSGTFTSEVPEKRKPRFNPEAKFSFSRPLARRVGVDGAILLKFLAHLMGKSTRTQDGRPYVRIASSELAEVYPWKTRRAWSDILKTLCDRGVLAATHEFRKSGIDQSHSYTVRIALSETEEEPISFRAGDAAEHGVCAAVLLHNLRYFLRANLDDGGAQGWHAMKPRRLSKHLPFFSESTIKRGLDTLTTAGVVQSRRNESIRASEYRIPGYVPIQAKPSDPVGRRAATSVPPESPADPPSNAVAAAVLSPAPQVETLDRIGFANVSTMIESNRKQLEGRSLNDVRILGASIFPEAQSLIQGISPAEFKAAQRWDDDQRLIFLILKCHEPVDVCTFAWEMAVLALRPWGVTVPPMPSSHDLILQKAYDLHLDLQNRANELRCQMAKDELGRRNEEMATALSELGEAMYATGIPAREKANLLRRVLNIRSGYGSAQQLYTAAPVEFAPYRIRATERGIKGAEKFFKQNPAWTAHSLFSIIEKCADLPENTEGEWDKHFHARKATDVAFLLKHLDKIISNFGMNAEVPSLKCI